jgi:hypothetical protein
VNASEQIGTGLVALSLGVKISAPDADLFCFWLGPCIAKARRVRKAHLIPMMNDISQGTVPVPLTSEGVAEVKAVADAAAAQPNRRRLVSLQLRQ